MLVGVHTVDHTAASPTAVSDLSTRSNAVIVLLTLRGGGWLVVIPYGYVWHRRPCARTCIFHPSAVCPIGKRWIMSLWRYEGALRFVWRRLPSWGLLDLTWLWMLCHAHGFEQDRREEEGNEFTFVQLKHIQFIFTGCACAWWQYSKYEGSKKLLREKWVTFVVTVGNDGRGTECQQQFNW